jgi:hypothetical protein
MMEDIININNIEYYSKERYEKDLNEIKDKLNSLLTKTEKKKALRFEEKQYIRLVKLLSGIFQIEGESITEDWAMENEFYAVDPANVCMAIPKTEEAKRILAIFRAFEPERNSYPNMDYIPEYKFFPDKEPKEQIKIKEQKVKLSQEYLRKILEILNVTDDAVELTVKKDYPITVENMHFKFILAPRIEND